MKKNIKNLLYCLTFFLIFGCGSDDGVDQENAGDNQVSGTITLSGVETSELGTSLTVGNIEVANTSLTGTDKSVILLSQNISVVDNELVYDDYQNGFVLVAADFSTGGSADIDKSISMTIVKDGEEYSHACSSPYLNFFTVCGDGFGIDFDAKSVTFDGTTVINTEDDTILTMDGTITWD
ncbi:hypothetical protein [Maribacter arenosus]|jgi:hypothetical protein|uniref:Lipoprotein n=1 Tax=Maribacter arenosus TaxID=1854708 RepID=A0ABR7VF26_9FLAO|nr:hypothetical protein [Maribacter arenosus]MBD0851916.1 hypothetical protein [Maribacter arenosus]